jgi:predicted metal-binding membrane protein
MARAMESAPVHRYRNLGYGVLAGAAAWVGVILLSRSTAMGMGATMGMAPAAFLGAWTLMMAAMMLPSVAPVAALYVRALDRQHVGRLVLFVLGYLLVWALLGVPAFAVALAFDSLSMRDPALLRWTLVAILLAVAAYQLTPLKRACLLHCRSPLSQLLKYASLRGPLRDLSVGGHHGLYCAGCCWPLMLLLVAAGVMNLVVMLALTACIAAEKLLPKGELVTRAIAVAALATAVLLVASPVPLGQFMPGGGVGA